MEPEKKIKRYNRIIGQLSDLLPKTNNRLARMSTIVALLHHKMDGFFWTGFYFLHDDKLIVGPYQGPVACQELKKGKGVCWAAVEKKQTIVVPDVDKFPEHIACDSRSKSEIVVPVTNEDNEIVAVLDIDSTIYSNFSKDDGLELERIVKMIYS